MTTSHESDEPILTDEFYSIEELAELLKVSVNTIYEWNSVGAGPAYYRIGRYVRYRKADVEVWLAARRLDRHLRRVS